MEKICNIRKYVKANKKLGFEGYQSIKSYLKGFSTEELEYIETSFIVAKESNERLMQFRDVVPTSIAMYALIVTLVPDLYKQNHRFFNVTLAILLIIGIITILIFISQQLSVKGD